MKLSEEQIAEFRERGYLFFPGLLEDREVMVLRGAVQELLQREGPEVVREETDPNVVKMVFGAHLFEDTYRRLACHPDLLIPTEQLLGSKAHVFQSRYNPKIGFAGGGWGWHQDFNQWYRQDGMKHPRALMTSVFLDDNNACNAPLMVIPGSHKRGHIYVPDRMEIELETIRELVEAGGIEALIGPPGSVLFLDCITVHGSTQNMSPWPRGIFYFNYNSVENRELESRRAVHHCSTDFTPLEPLEQDCLVA